MTREPCSTEQCAAAMMTSGEEGRSSATWKIALAGRVAWADTNSSLLNGASNNCLDWPATVYGR
jgi:hypothetical protein